jgi:hypothetical protein
VRQKGDDAFDDPRVSRMEESVQALALPQEPEVARTEPGGHAFQRVHCQAVAQPAFDAADYRPRYASSVSQLLLSHAAPQAECPRSWPEAHNVRFERILDDGASPLTCRTGGPEVRPDPNVGAVTPSSATRGTG